MKLYEIAYLPLTDDNVHDVVKSIAPRASAVRYAVPGQSASTLQYSISNVNLNAFAQTDDVLDTDEGELQTKRFFNKLLSLLKKAFGVTFAVDDHYLIDSPSATYLATSLVQKDD